MAEKEKEKDKTNHVVIEGKPKDLSALAGMLVNELNGYITEQVSAPQLLFGTVTVVDAGPPATITATLNGSDIPYIRYIGSTPVVGNVVAVLVANSRYLCLGVLS